jgi:hypothetical protein
MRIWIGGKLVCFTLKFQKLLIVTSGDSLLGPGEEKIKSGQSKVFESRPCDLVEHVTHESKAQKSLDVNERIPNGLS